MINMLTTIWMSSVDKLEGAIEVSVQNLPPIPPTPRNPKGHYLRRPTASASSHTAMRKDGGLTHCIQKTFGFGMDQLSRVRGAQGGFSGRTHIIATLVQTAALWGAPGGGNQPQAATGYGDGGAA